MKPKLQIVRYLRENSVQEAIYSFGVTDEVSIYYTYKFHGYTFVPSHLSPYEIILIRSITQKNIFPLASVDCLTS